MGDVWDPSLCATLYQTVPAEQMKQIAQQQTRLRSRKKENKLIFLQQPICDESLFLYFRIVLTWKAAFGRTALMTQFCGVARLGNQVKLSKFKLFFKTSGSEKRKIFTNSLFCIILEPRERRISRSLIFIVHNCNALYHEKNKEMKTNAIMREIKRCQESQRTFT